MKCVKGNQHGRIIAMDNTSTGEDGNQGAEMGFMESMGAGLDIGAKWIKGNRYGRLTTVKDSSTGEGGTQVKDVG